MLSAARPQLTDKYQVEARLNCKIPPPAPVTASLQLHASTEMSHSIWSHCIMRGKLPVMFNCREKILSTTYCYTYYSSRNMFLFSILLKKMRRGAWTCAEYKILLIFRMYPELSFPFFKQRVHHMTKQMDSKKNFSNNYSNFPKSRSYILGSAPCLV